MTNRDRRILKTRILQNTIMQALEHSENQLLDRVDTAFIIMTCIQNKFNLHWKEKPVEE